MILANNLSHLHSVYADVLQAQGIVPLPASQTGPSQETGLGSVAAIPPHADDALRPRKRMGPDAVATESASKRQRLDVSADDEVALRNLTVTQDTTDEADEELAVIEVRL